MAQDQDAKSQAGNGGAAVACTSVEDMLKEVVNELNEFDAKKLTDLKTELDAFVKKKDAVVDDYRKKYPTLRDRWCAQHQLIENLYHSLQCAYPGQDWKAIVAECICTPKHDCWCLEQKINRRRRCYQGVRERARDQAKAAFDKVKARLDALTANAQKIDAELTDDDKLIKDIQGLVPGAEQAVALYLFWFRLLPSHVRLMPKEVSADCAKFAVDENAATLCADVMKQDCPKDDNPCAPAADEAPAKGAKTSDRVPWLLPPDDYAGAIDCAWQDYRAAKHDMAQTDAAFKADPDDVASLDKKLSDAKAALEATIKNCLKSHKPDDTCCTKADTAPSAAAKAQE